jgi:hypothetical protein
VNGAPKKCTSPLLNGVAVLDIKKKKKGRILLIGISLRDKKKIKNKRNQTNTLFSNSMHW